MAPFSVKIAFVESQHANSSHPKLLKQLIQHYKKSDFEQFVDQFSNLLKYPLIHGDKQPTIERILNFVAKFATAVKHDKQNKRDDTTTTNDDDDEEDVEAEIDPFLVRIFQFLLDNHEANSKAVRFRVCQLINKILNNMGEQASIDDDLYNNIYDTMLQRLLDKIPSVRLQAILALARLQDPTNKECRIIKAYRFHLSMDPNPDVRRAVLNNIAITFQTLPDVIDRIRDVRDSVRRQVYLVLAQKVHIRSLTIEQRVRLISEGLNERSDTVKSAVEKILIPAWLRLVNGNVLDLLTCLDVEASTKDAELALRSLFTGVPYCDLIEKFNVLNQHKVIEESELRPESALYWRVLVEYLRSESAEESLEVILPDLTPYCKYVKDYVLGALPEIEDDQQMALKMMEKEFVVQQLVAITLHYDLTDEVGRNSLDNLVRSLLVCPDVGENSIKSLVDAFAKLHPPTSRINQLAEIISEVRDASSTDDSSTLQDSLALNDAQQRSLKVKLAKVKMELNELRDEVEDCIRSLDLERAQELKEEIKIKDEEKLSISKQLANSSNVNTSTTEEEIIEQKDDPETLIRCLTIVCQMLKDLEVSTITPTLHSLHDNLVIPCLKSQDPGVRNFSIQALGLICLLSEDYTKKHLLLFAQISQIDNEEIQITALQCMFDFLHLYGIDTFLTLGENLANLPDVDLPNKKKNSDDEDDDLNQDENTIITMLAKGLENKSSEIRTHVAEGLCRLLLSSRISSSSLLTHLILMWFNPNSEDDHMVRHMLGVFFPLYASHGGSNQEVLSAAVLPTLHTLFDAPSRSPLASVDIEEVAYFLFNITSPLIVSDSSKKLVNAHDSLVLKLCADMLTYDGPFMRSLVKCLSHLSLSPTNYTTLKQVDALVEKLTKKITDKQCLKTIEKFHTSVLNCLNEAPEPEKEMEDNDKTIQDVTQDTTTLDSTLMDKTLETTLIRKKRLLYNTMNTDILSSDFDSEIDTPKKKPHLNATEKKQQNKKVEEMDNNEDKEFEIKDDPDEDETTLSSDCTFKTALDTSEKTIISETPEESSQSPTKHDETANKPKASPAKSTRGRKRDVPDESSEESQESRDDSFESQESSDVFVKSPLKTERRGRGKKVVEESPSKRGRGRPSRAKKNEEEAIESSSQSPVEGGNRKGRSSSKIDIESSPNESLKSPAVRGRRRNVVIPETPTTPSSNSSTPSNSAGKRSVSTDEEFQSPLKIRKSRRSTEKSRQTVTKNVPEKRAARSSSQTSVESPQPPITKRSKRKPIRIMTASSETESSADEIESTPEPRRGGSRNQTKKAVSPAKKSIQKKTGAKIESSGTSSEMSSQSRRSRLQSSQESSESRSTRSSDRPRRSSRK